TILFNSSLEKPNPMFDLLRMRQMETRGNEKFIRNYFLAFQSGSQTRNERPSKQSVPIRIKRCATTAPPISPCPYWTYSICVFRDTKAWTGERFL
ncbi:hypothetical protein CDAR_386671, partial [Caerostris darwini]